MTSGSIFFCIILWLRCLHDSLNLYYQSKDIEYCWDNCTRTNQHTKIVKIYFRLRIVNEASVFQQNILKFYNKCRKIWGKKATFRPLRPHIAALYSQLLAWFHLWTTCAIPLLEKYLYLCKKINGHKSLHHHHHHHVSL